MSLHAPQELIETAARSGQDLAAATQALAASGEMPFALNPFGAVFTVATWTVLIALNVYCLLKLLRHQPAEVEDPWAEEWPELEGEALAAGAGSEALAGGLHHSEAA